MQLQTSDGPSSSEVTYTMVNSDGPDSERNISQLFSSFPALDEASSLLTQTTSYFTRCFTGYVDEATPGEIKMEEFVSSSHANESPSGGCRSSFVRWPSLSHDARASSCKNSGGTPSESFSEHATEIVTSSPTVNGLSIFQGLVDRARKTMRGSADDIGWLERAEDMPPVEDGTERFMELLDNIRCNRHKLPNSLVYLLVPGLFSNHGPLYFVSTKTFFSKMGLACHIAKIHSEASVEKNAREIKEYIEEIYWGSKKRVLLLGHSKGGVDAAAALSLYWDDLKDKVAGLALAQSPYGGTPIASDILREGQLGDYVNLRKIMEIVISKVLKGDIQALEDLTYERRKDFLTRHSLPPGLPVVSFHTEASIRPSVLGSLSHVAHAELPTVVDGQPAKLPVVVPLAAAMAACAQMLQSRYGEKSDGLVTRRDAEVPGSVVVRPTKKMDHAWMVYAPLNVNSDEAESARVFEALLTLLVEVAQKRRHEVSLKDE